MEEEKTALTTILIAEDYEVNRCGLKMLFDSVDDFRVVGEAPNGEKCVQLTTELNPTVVVMDVRMPLLDGISATRKIKELAPLTKIIMLTSHPDQETVVSSLEAGADGYCLKDVRTPQLISAIRAVASGACWLDPGIVSIVMRASSSTPAKAEGPLLTESEKAVLKLIVDGLSNSEISKRLYMGQDSVKIHIRRILEKMAVSGRTQAAVKAVKEGLV